LLKAGRPSQPVHRLAHRRPGGGGSLNGGGMPTRDLSRRSFSEGGTLPPPLGLQWTSRPDKCLVVPLIACPP
jgi:hypothetical protein